MCVKPHLCVNIHWLNISSNNKVNNVNYFTAIWLEICSSAKRFMQCGYILYTYIDRYLPENTVF